MVIYLKRGADVHTTQLMPLPLTVSCFREIQTGLPFTCYRLTHVVAEKGPLNMCDCVCMCSVLGRQMPLVLFAQYMDKNK